MRRSRDSALTDLLCCLCVQRLGFRMRTEIQNGAAGTRKGVRNHTFCHRPLQKKVFKENVFNCTSRNHKVLQKSRSWDNLRCSTETVLKIQHLAATVSIHTVKPDLQFYQHSSLPTRIVQKFVKYLLSLLTKIRVSFKVSHSGWATTTKRIQYHGGNISQFKTRVPNIQIHSHNVLILIFK